MNQSDEFLLLRCPQKIGWQVPSGALESGETPLQALTRELAEELGKEFLHRTLGPVDVSSFRIDHEISLLSIGFLVQYLGGAITPGDDMADAEIAWMSIKEVTRLENIAVPENTSHFARALELFRLLKT